jgi:glycosyltransferase involved in cell wall biosynthesis
VVGFIGSFYSYEGLELLVRAMVLLSQTRPNLRLLLVGGGPAEASLKAMVEASDLQSSVIFTGRVPHAEVNSYYDLIDVLAYPRHSMRLTELVTPLKPLEAMAQGRVFVASDVGGHRELIEDGVNGVLFRADDVQALVHALQSLLEDRSRWSVLRENGRRYVTTVRNWTNSVAAYRPAYESMVNR